MSTKADFHRYKERRDAIGVEFNAAWREVEQTEQYKIALVAFADLRRENRRVNQCRAKLNRAAQIAIREEEDADTQLKRAGLNAMKDALERTNRTLQG